VYASDLSILKSGVDLNMRLLQPLDGISGAALPGGAKGGEEMSFEAQPRLELEKSNKMASPVPGIWFSGCGAIVVHRTCQTGRTRDQ
jgi:hypothetical protein